MFERFVRIDDTTYTSHEVISVEHLLNRPTMVSAKSYSRVGSKTRKFSTTDSTVTDISSAEEWVKTLPEFAEAEDPAEIAAREAEAKERAARAAQEAAQAAERAAEAERDEARQQTEQAVETAKENMAKVINYIPDEDAGKVYDFFPDWVAGVAYAVDDRVKYDSSVYRCVIAHTSQSDWEPPDVPALWVKIADEDIDPDPETIAEWVQPTGAHDAYPKDAKVRHNESVWISTIDYNVYEPGVYGWTVVE